MKIFDNIILKYYIKLHNYLYHQISKLSLKLNNGLHPKHRIMNYFQFFLDNIDEDSKILDIGCGIGFVAYKLSEKAQSVCAIDINKNSIEFAKRRNNRDNINYIHADVKNYEFKENFDCIVLSNVLEHIKDRKKFLIKIKGLSKYLLVRVPMINRSWLVLYKKELGHEYRLDSSHYIEYTIDSFQNEIESVGLKVIFYSIQFGEIWAKIGINKS